MADTQGIRHLRHIACRVILRPLRHLPFCIRHSRDISQMVIPGLKAVSFLIRIFRYPSKGIISIPDRIVPVLCLGGHGSHLVPAVICQFQDQTQGIRFPDAVSIGIIFKGCGISIGIRG